MKNDAKSGKKVKEERLRGKREAQSQRENKRLNKKEVEGVGEARRPLTGQVPLWITVAPCSIGA